VGCSCVTERARVAALPVRLTIAAGESIHKLIAKEPRDPEPSSDGLVTANGDHWEFRAGP